MAEKSKYRIGVITTIIYEVEADNEDDAIWFVEQNLGNLEPSEITYDDCSEAFVC